jgi:hypothetical protein
MEIEEAEFLYTKKPSSRRIELVPTKKRRLLWSSTVLDEALF